MGGGHWVVSKIVIKVLLVSNFPQMTSALTVMKNMREIITMTSWWARWRLKSPASQLFTRPFIQAQIKEKIKASRYWPVWGEFTGDQWIPRTKKGQQRGKYFHLMTSSCDIACWVGTVTSTPDSSNIVSACMQWVAFLDCCGDTQQDT